MDWIWYRCSRALREMSSSLTGGRYQVVRERDLNCQLTEAGRIMAEGLRNCIRKYVRPESHSRSTWTSHHWHGRNKECSSFSRFSLTRISIRANAGSSKLDLKDRRKRTQRQAQENKKTGTTGHKDRHRKTQGQEQEDTQIQAQQDTKDWHKRTHRHAPSDATTGTRAHMDRNKRTQRRAQQDKRTGIKTQGRHERT